MFCSVKLGNLPVSIQSQGTISKYMIQAKILNYKKGPNETKLDKYLVKNYKISLVPLCISLIYNCTFQINTAEKTITIIFKNYKYDKLARLITFGNESVKGSNILLDSICK